MTVTDQVPKWEYRIEPWPTARPLDDLTASLNDLGWQGWEFCGFWPQHMTSSHLLFKRPR